MTNSVIEACFWDFSNFLYFESEWHVMALMKMLIVELVSRSFLICFGLVRIRVWIS